jgi:hypothetical protein
MNSLLNYDKVRSIPEELTGLNIAAVKCRNCEPRRTTAKVAGSSASAAAGSWSCARAGAEKNRRAPRSNGGSCGVNRARMDASDRYSSILHLEWLSRLPLACTVERCFLAGQHTVSRPIEHRASGEGRLAGGSGTATVRHWRRAHVSACRHRSQCAETASIFHAISTAAQRGG